MTVVPTPVALPYNVRRWAQVRIYVASAWGQSYRALPMLSPARNGFQLLRYKRTCLPDEGTAVFRLPYGRIDARVFADATFSANELGAPDLHQYEVKIQGLKSTGDWMTIWSGQIVAMRDACYPGSDVPAGDMEYHCVDGFARLRKWYLNYHEVYWDSHGYRSEGHPGYNARHGVGDREASGADPFGLGFESHTWPSKDASVAVMWTDQKVVEHALKSSVPGLLEAATTSADITAARAKVPTFPLYGSTDWLQGKNVYPVRVLEDVRSLLVRVFERGRGKGLAFYDWTDDSGADPSGALAPRITIRPPVQDDLSIAQPSAGGTISMVGSDGAGTTKILSVIGDHRLGEDAQRTFQVTATSDTECTGVEVLSEPIIVLTNLSEKDTSLEGRWLAGELSDFTGATRKQRELYEVKYDHVYRRWGIPKGWDMKCGDGTGNNRTRVDYRFDINGLLQTPTGSNVDTSPLLVGIDDRLPMYFGYDYTIDPIATFHGDPPGDIAQVPMAAWIRVSDSPERYINACHSLGLSVSRHEQDLRIACADDHGGRSRIIGDPTVASLGSRYKSDQMVLLVGLILPHRLRLLKSANVADTTGGTKVKRIFVRDHHVWVAHPKAIIALDYATASNGGYAPKRSAVTPPIYLRDDRDRLSVILNLSAVWYLNRRKSATWTLSDYGYCDGWFQIGSDGLEDTSNLKPWVGLGDLIDEFGYSGRTEELKTPVTMVEYSHIDGRYTWATSWTDLDWR